MSCPGCQLQQYWLPTPGARTALDKMLLNTGTIPWFYNQVLPIAEPAVMSVTKKAYFAFN